MPSRMSTDDPLARAIAPPKNESPEDRQDRLRAEFEAKKRSDAIDEEINRQRLAEKKKPSSVKILLLGQSESGKSTTLKNFQLMNSPKAFRAELPSWRAVIQLNIIRSVRLILEALKEGKSSASSAKYPPLSAEHLKLGLKLSPLLQIEEALTRKLTSDPTIWMHGETVDSALSQITDMPPRREIAVNSRSSWKSYFSKMKVGSSDQDEDVGIDWNDPQDPGRVLYACREDMIQLWNDHVVQEILTLAKIRLEELSGFFLDQLGRVTAEKYVPTNDDILRARLKTVGITEYRFKMDSSGGAPGFRPVTMGSDWRVFDVGGARSLRAAWVPFFDDVNAVIFLAPISCFDQVLAEDHTVNRLEDSVHLWTSIVSNPLLSTVSLVLFLNKCDILEAKLKSGIQLSDYIVSYAGRSNDFDTASYYLRKKFSGIHRDKSPKPRPFYSHFTSVTDSKTPSILRHVQESVILNNLKRGGLMG